MFKNTSTKGQKLAQGVLDELVKAVGKEYVRTNVEELVCYSYDATSTRQRAVPDVVIKASTTEEVSAVVKVADKNNIPVYPCGARSGLSGGSIPLYGGIVLDTTRMNRILEVNTQDLMATVEPGVVTKRFQDEVAKYKLFYPPDPGSAEFSTLGGNIAECSGGMAGIKYGVTRDYVLSLEVVLPSGSVINTGRKTWRTVAGYDLTRLFVGSEGTLGVVTKITVKLIPLPATVETVLAYFKYPGDAVDAADGIILEHGVIPKTLEFVDSICIDTVRGYGGVDIPAEAKALLLVDVDGDHKIVRRDRLRVEDACKKYKAFHIIVAEDEVNRTALWQVRRVISPALFKISGKIRPAPKNPIHVGFKILKPSFLPKGYRLVGCSCATFDDISCAHMQFSNGANTISLFQRRAGREAPPAPVHSKVTHVLTWAHSGMQFTLMGDLPRPQLRKIADSVH